MRLTANSLVEACSDEGVAAGITIQSELQPLAGLGAPVKPAVYEGGVYQQDRRWIVEGEQRRVVEVVIIDNVASEANHLEAALLNARGEVGLPELVLDLGGLGLPVHLPESISSFQFPHRNADAYLRDAELDGVAFPTTPQGRAIFAATADDPSALFEWMPQALLFGFWQSHLGKKRQQTKWARAWVSEIVGYEPAASDTKTKGLKGDPLNLTIDEGVAYDDRDQLEWTVIDAARKGKKSKDSLAELGHGQVPVTSGPAGVSFARISQQSSVSLARLRSVHAATPAASAAGRALLVAIGLFAHVDAFGRAFSLRSGCDLRPTSTTWRWLGERQDQDVEPLDHAAAVALVAGCAEVARGEGLPVGDDWPQPLTLTPRDNLRSAIAKTWPAVGDA